MYKTVSVWADGSACKDPGCGGWASIMVAGDAALIMVGQREGATHNEVEALAVLEALQRLKNPCLVTVYTDSTYVIDGMVALAQGRMFQTHVHIWKSMYDVYYEQLAVRMEHVTAHKASTAPIHRYCDRLSRRASHREVSEYKNYIKLDDLLNEAKA